MTDEMDPRDWIPDEDEEPTVNGTPAHPSPGFAEALAAARAQTEMTHGIVASLADLRRAAGLTQVELAERWGRGQSYVSKVERDPAGVEMATLLSYVRALGGRLTLTVEAGENVFIEDLVS